MLSGLQHLLSCGVLTTASQLTQAGVRLVLGSVTGLNLTYVLVDTLLATGDAVHKSSEKEWPCLPGVRSCAAVKRRDRVSLGLHVLAGKGMQKGRCPHVERCLPDPGTSAVGLRICPTPLRLTAAAGAGSTTLHRHQAISTACHATADGNPPSASPSVAHPAPCRPEGRAEPAGPHISGCVGVLLPRLPQRCHAHAGRGSPATPASRRGGRQGGAGSAGGNLWCRNRCKDQGAGGTAGGHTAGAGSIAGGALVC